jgi:hypothetical protein
MPTCFEDFTSHSFSMIEIVGPILRIDLDLGDARSNGSNEPDCIGGTLSPATADGTGPDSRTPAEQAVWGRSPEVEDGWPVGRLAGLLFLLRLLVRITINRTDYQVGSSG